MDKERTRRFTPEELSRMDKAREERAKVAREKFEKGWRKRTKSDIKHARLRSDLPYAMMDTEGGGGTNSYMTGQLVKAEVNFEKGNYKLARNILVKTYNDMRGWIERENSVAQTHPEYNRRANQYLDSIAKRAKRFASKLRQSENYEEADNDELATSFDGLAEKAENVKGSRKLEKMFYTNPYVWVSLLGILFGLFFLSPNITGAAVGVLAQSSSNIWGVIMFVFGLLGLFISLR